MTKNRIYIRLDENVIDLKNHQNCQSELTLVVIDITFYPRGGRFKSPNSQLL